jgi:polyisoprenoid-binding protein YceI
MKRTRLWLAFASLAVLLSAMTAGAEPLAYKLDPGHTSVGFSVRHFFSKVPGKFTDFEGTVLIDEKNWAASSVEATIQAKSINTNNERRDNDLRSENFFDVEKFPTLTFKSTKVTPAGDKKLKVEGDLTMHGVTKPVTLDVEILGLGNVAIGGRAMGSRAGFEATTTIDRKDFGIVWNRTLDQGGTMLGDDVAISIGVEAVKPAADAPKPAAANEKPEKTEKTDKK